MKSLTSKLSVAIFAAGLFFASGVTHAAILAAWDVWSDGTGTSYDADAELSGFQGVIENTDTSNRVLSPFGSNDGTFGTVSDASATDTRAMLVRKGNTGTNNSGWNILTITITNSTGNDYNIDSLHFDIGVRTSSGNAFTLEYTGGGLGAAGTTLASASGLGATGDSGVQNLHDFDVSLASSLADITLGTGESAVFTLTIDDYVSNSASSVLDNVLVQGTFIPEPSTAILAGLGLLGIFFRRRK